MLGTGQLNPTDLVNICPDTVGSVIITTASAVVAQDYPTNAGIATFTGTVGFYLNGRTTSVTVPSTNSAGTTASSGLNEWVAAGIPITRQVGGLSTGYSLTSTSSGVVTVAFWKK